MPDQFTRNENAILTGKNARYLIYPAPTGVPAVGVVLTSGVGAWGISVDIVAAAAITTEWYICGWELDTNSAATVTELQIGVGAAANTAPIYAARINPTSATLLNLPILPCPFPMWMPANTEISGRIGTTAAKVLGVSMLYTLAL